MGSLVWIVMINYWLGPLWDCKIEQASWLACSLPLCSLCPAGFESKAFTSIQSQWLWAVYCRLEHRALMPSDYWLPFLKSVTVMHMAEVLSHLTVINPCSAVPLFTVLLSAWWGECIPCCSSGSVTCWPVCQHQVILSTDFSPTRRWTLDFKNVSNFSFLLVVMLCLPFTEILILRKLHFLHK